MTSRRIIFFFLFILAANTSRSQDTLIMTQLLSRIEALQAKESSVFPRGLFPSYRMYALNKNREKADVNIFFTGLIVMTLRDIRPQLTREQGVIADRIIRNAEPTYQKFQNRKGRPTYNFWPTDTPRIFPNAGWMNLLDKSQALPDDLDDTVIMLLAMNAPDTTAKLVHELMQGFTNNSRKKVRNTFTNYRDIGAYSTWFGRKMPVDFDVCVLANVLYFVQRYNLPWTAADSASLHLIEKVLQEKKHITDAAYVSPHYNQPPNILYHLSRLMSVKPIPSLAQYKNSLVEQTREAFVKTGNFMDEVLLGTALLRWDVAPPVIKTHLANNWEDLAENGAFSFFIANMASMLPNPLKQWMGGAGVGKFYYNCTAYQDLLLLEYLVWNNKKAALH